MRCDAMRDATSQAPSWDSFLNATTKLEKKAISLLFLSFRPPPVSFVGDATPEAEVARRSALPGYEISCLLSPDNQPRQRCPRPRPYQNPSIGFSYRPPPSFLGIVPPASVSFLVAPETNSNRLLVGPLPLGLPV